jgi:hypothetical protein
MQVALDQQLLVHQVGLVAQEVPVMEPYDETCIATTADHKWITSAWSIQ